MDVTEVSRTFDYDYIYFDAIFLIAWIIFIINRKKYIPLIWGVIEAILIYTIDAIIWWNAPAENSASGYIREYRIGGIEMPHPLGNYFWLKFGADFMMTISYSLFAFTWMIIMFESWKTNNKKDMWQFTLFLFIAWLLTPYLSIWLHWNDTEVYTIRHMESQLIAQVMSVVIGYLLVFLIYRKKIWDINNNFKNSTENKDGKNQLSNLQQKNGTPNSKRNIFTLLLYLFFVGCFQAFAMEFPLLISGIRPTNIELFVYEVIILINQGVPYTFIFWDKILPLIIKRFKKTN